MVRAVAAVPGGSERRLEAVRAWWRLRHPPPGIGRRLDLLYTAALMTGILGALVYGTASSGSHRS